MLQKNNYLNQPPKVSIGVLSYNNAAYLPFTIESILKQTFTNFEVIIIDDGSSDNSLEIANSYAIQDHRIQVVTHPNNINKGISETCNLAVKKSSGEFIALIASDDEYLPSAIEKQTDFLIEHPDIGFVCGISQFMDEKGKNLNKTIGEKIWSDKEILENMLSIGNIISAPTVMVRRACYDEVGLYNPNLIYNDYELWVRILLFSDWKMGYIDEILAKYRVHGRNISLSVPFIINTERKYALLSEIKILIDKNPQGKKMAKILNNALAKECLDLFYLLCKAGKNFPAVNYLIKSVFYNPSSFLNARRLASVIYRLFKGIKFSLNHKSPNPTA